MTFRILIADKLAEAGLKQFDGQDDFIVDNKPGLSPEEQLEIIGDYHGLVVRSATKVTPALLEKATQLKIVIRAGIGVDNIDIPACTKAGVLVENTPFGNALSAAEHAIGLMFAAARHIATASASTKAGKWEKSRFVGIQLGGKTLGLIGAGNVGGLVARHAKGIGMNVVAFDPALTEARAAELGIEKLEKEELFARADVVSLHVPLLDATRGILNADAFAAMKDGVIIVNAGRGGTIDEAALDAAMESGKVSAAALDVFETEPVPADNPLLKRENVVATPHLGASTKDAQLAVAVDAANQMMAYLRNGEQKFALNQLG